MVTWVGTTALNIVSILGTIMSLITMIIPFFILYVFMKILGVVGITPSKLFSIARGNMTWSEAIEWPSPTSAVSGMFGSWFGGNNEDPNS